MTIPATQVSAATITEAVDDRWVIGTYFGYMNNVYYYNAPTTLHLGVEKVLEDPNIDYKLNFTFNQAQEREIRYAMSNNFGFGGHNASLLFKKL